ncbi:MAG: hypothetical protein H6741_32800 [Alphaproteobacteria bacterium]|nr:hypothetical protein [Alphaproteobacteria bacterium]
MSTDWLVHAHGPLEPLSENLWHARGSLPNMGLPRRMVVVRRADGGLIVHSAVCLEEAQQAALEALGPVRFILVPNALHRYDAARYAARYPEAKVLCPRGGRQKVEEKVRVDGTLEELPADGVARIRPLEGVGSSEAALEVRSQGGVSLVLNDVLFNLPHQPGFGGLFTRLIGSSGGPKVTPIARMMMVKDKPALAQCLRGLADTPDLVRVIPAHGDVIDQDPAGVLRAVAGSL